MSKIKCPKCGSDFLLDDGPVEVGVADKLENLEIARIYTCGHCGYQFDTSQINISENKNC